LLSNDTEQRPCLQAKKWNPSARAQATAAVIRTKTRYCAKSWTRRATRRRAVEARRRGNSPTRRSPATHGGVVDNRQHADLATVDWPRKAELAPTSRSSSTLDRLSELINWSPVACLLEPLYPASKGEPAWPPLAMFAAAGGVA